MKYNGFIRPQSYVQRNPKRAGKTAQELAQRGYSRQPSGQQSMRGSVGAYDREEGLMTISLYRCSDA